MTTAKNTMNPLRHLASKLGVAAALVASASASAQDITAGDWKFRAQIYGWFPSVSGTTALPPSSGSGGAAPNVDLSNYMDALQFAFMGSFEARKGRLGVLTDYVYLNFEADRSASRDLNLSGPLGQINIPASATADVKAGLSGYVWTLVGTYAAIEDPTIDLQWLGGVRYLKAKPSLEWRLNGNVGSLPPYAVAGSASAAPGAWDAVIGAKGRVKFGSSAWFAPYYVDVGTGQSDLTWQAMAGVGYTFSWGDVVAAYRHLDYRFPDSFAMKDLSFSGPGVAVGFRW
jgi:hypothetical protein